MLARLPFGSLVLVGLGIGLAGYAALNIAGAFNDPERRGVTLGGITARSVDALTGAVYIGLAIAALGRVADPSGATAGTAESWARALLALSYGRIFLGLVSAALLIGGVFLFYRALRERFGEMLDRREVSARARRAIEMFARAGTAARGLIFIVCGMLVSRAAAKSDPDIVGDAGDALAAIGSTPVGPLLLAATGAGFVAYGLYQLAKARYQRIRSG